MTANRLHDPTPLQRHHSALAEELIEAVGGLKRAEAFSRVAKSALSDYACAHVNRYMPSDVIEALEKRAGRPVFTDYLARAVGFLLIRMPEAEAEPWGRDLRELGKDFGEVSSAICECLGDDDSPGRITGAEVRKFDLITKLDRLAEITAEMRAQALLALGEGEGRR